MMPLQWVHLPFGPLINQGTHHLQQLPHYQHSTLNTETILMRALPASHPLYYAKAGLLNNLSFSWFSCELFLPPLPQQKKSQVI